MPLCKCPAAARSLCPTHSLCYVRYSSRQCPTHYAMSGTDLGYVLRVRYGMSGTELGYAATRRGEDFRLWGEHEQERLL
eukprot:3131792-Rhodomonas_salina.2